MRYPTIYKKQQKTNTPLLPKGTVMHISQMNLEIFINREDKHMLWIDTRSDQVIGGRVRNVLTILFI